MLIFIDRTTVTFKTICSISFQVNTPSWGRIERGHMLASPKLWSGWPRRPSSLGSAPTNQLKSWSVTPAAWSDRSGCELVISCTAASVEYIRDHLLRLPNPWRTIPKPFHGMRVVQIFQTNICLAMSGITKRTEHAHAFMHSLCLQIILLTNQFKPWREEIPGCPPKRLKRGSMWNKASASVQPPGRNSFSQQDQALTWSNYAENKSGM